MLGQFGTTPIIGMFQGKWVGTSWTSIAHQGIHVPGSTTSAPARTGVGVLIISLNNLPASVPGAVAANTTGVSDSTVLVQLEQFGGAAEEVDILYGPGAGAYGATLAANQIQLSFKSGGTLTDPTSITLNGIAYQCQDGSFTPETP
jgi:hypothetical protein